MPLEMPLLRSASISTNPRSLSSKSTSFCLSTAYTTDSDSASCAHPLENCVDQPTDLSGNLNRVGDVDIPLKPDRSIYSFAWSSVESNHLAVETSQNAHIPSESIDIDMTRPYTNNVIPPSRVRHVPPTLPAPTFWTTLAHPDLFEKYIIHQDLLPRDRNAKPPPGSDSAAEAAFKEHPSEAYSKHLGNIRAIVKANTDESKVVRNCITEWVADHCKDHLLPCPFSINLFEQSILWVQSEDGGSRSNFKKLPDLSDEGRTVRWLNHLATNLRRCHKIKSSSLTRHRCFTNEGANKCLSGGLVERKPDIVLIDEVYRKKVPSHIRIKWTLVQAIVEITAQDTRTFNDHMKGVLTKAANILHTQIHRQFVLAIVLFGKGKKMSFFCCIIDRVSAACTIPLPLMGYGGRILARVVYTMAFGDDTLLGHDSAITIDRLTGDPVSVVIEHQTFTFVTDIFSSPYLFGRGTHVFIVQDKYYKYYILKDSWILVSHNVSEANNIRLIGEAAQGDDVDPRLQALLPRLIACDENAGSTSLNRCSLPAKGGERRRRRLVTGPIGDPITSYCSRVECLQAFIDIADRKCSKFSMYIIQLLNTRRA